MQKYCKSQNHVQRHTGIKDSFVPAAGVKFSSHKKKKGNNTKYPWTPDSNWEADCGSDTARLGLAR